MKVLTCYFACYIYGDNKEEKSIKSIKPGKDFKNIPKHKYFLGIDIIISFDGQSMVWNNI